jgi:hypothetical protein
MPFALLEEVRESSEYGKLFCRTNMSQESVSKSFFFSVLERDKILHKNESRNIEAGNVEGWMTDLMFLVFVTEEPEQRVTG